MKSRQRVKRAIHFRNPDRLPISLAVLPATKLKYGRALEEILATVPDDFGWHLLPDAKPEEFPAFYKKGKHYDEFGTLWQVETPGMLGRPVEFPLACWSNYRNYRWPEPLASPPRTKLYCAQMAGHDENFYARAAWITFFERMQLLRGPENLMLDLAYKTKELYRLRDDLLEFNLRWLDHWLMLELDGICFADDWGTQNALLISPQLWREFFKPVYQKMFARVKEKGLDVHFHSDGYIMDIIPDLLELGVDVLNCQESLIGVDELGRQFAGKICFQTNLDQQRIMPFASPDQVRAHILYVFDKLARLNGGLIASAEIGPDIPPENIRIMFKTFMEYVC